jgi:hypothetical protein
VLLRIACVHCRVRRGSRARSKRGRLGRAWFRLDRSIELEQRHEFGDQHELDEPDEQHCPDRRGGERRAVADDRPERPDESNRNGVVDGGAGSGERSGWPWQRPAAQQQRRLERGDEHERDHAAELADADERRRKFAVKLGAGLGSVSDRLPERTDDPNLRG